MLPHRRDVVARLLEPDITGQVHKPCDVDVEARDRNGLQGGRRRHIGVRVGHIAGRHGLACVRRASLVEVGLHRGRACGGEVAAGELDAAGSLQGLLAGGVDRQAQRAARHACGIRGIADGDFRVSGGRLHHAPILGKAEVAGDVEHPGEGRIEAGHGNDFQVGRLGQVLERVVDAADGDGLVGVFGVGVVVPHQGRIGRNRGEAAASQRDAAAGLQGHRVVRFHDQSQRAARHARGERTDAHRRGDTVCHCQHVAARFLERETAGEGGEPVDRQVTGVAETAHAGIEVVAQELAEAVFRRRGGRELQTPRRGFHLQAQSIPAWRGHDVEIPVAGGEGEQPFGVGERTRPGAADREEVERRAHLRHEVVDEPHFQRPVQRRVVGDLDLVEPVDVVAARRVARRRPTDLDQRAVAASERQRAEGRDFRQVRGQQASRLKHLQPQLLAPRQRRAVGLCFSGREPLATGINRAGHDEVSHGASFAGWLPEPTAVNCLISLQGFERITKRPARRAGLLPIFHVPGGSRFSEGSRS